MITVYGIKQCDSCRKALRWLVQTGLEAQFHDLRLDGLNEGMLTRWFASIGWEAVLNRRSTAWRSLADEERNFPLDESRVKVLCMAHPNLVKRPVFEMDGSHVVGFDSNAVAFLTGSS